MTTTHPAPKVGAKVDTRWFQNHLADVSMSQRRLAKVLGVDAAAVSLMLRGKRKMTAAEAAEIARILGVGAQEVLVRAGVAATIPARVPDRAAPVETTRLPSVDGLQKLETTPPGGQEMFEIPVPMSDGSVARLLLPRALAKADADRIAALVSAFAGG